MILTKADLLNKALLRLRHQQFDSFEETDPVHDAAQTPDMLEICNAAYPTSRNELLCMYYWEFASVTSTLQKDDTYNSSVPDYNVLFQYRYNLPDEMISSSPMRLFLQVPASVRMFSVSQNKLLANDGDLCIKYIREVKDTEARPPLFDSLHVLYLAQKITSLADISGTESQLLTMEFEKAFALAKTSDAKTAYQGKITTVTR